MVEASIRPPLEGDKYYPLGEGEIHQRSGAELVRDRVPFEHLVPLFPDEKFEITKGRYANISTRVVDMFSPIGKGQRALIVAPPKTGKDNPAQRYSKRNIRESSGDVYHHAPH